MPADGAREGAAGTTVRWTPVATLDELWEGEATQVEAANDSVLLVHLEGGGLRAYQAICPHQERPLVDGEIVDGILTCSAHSWEFDLRTGTGVNPERCRLYSYEVRSEDDRILVGVPQDSARHYNRCRGSDRGAEMEQPLPELQEQNHLVGPVVRGFDPDVVDTLLEAIEQDNPGRAILVDDRSGYVRIHAPRRLRVTRASLEQAAGHPIALPSLEPAIAGFAGRMKYMGDDELVWYLDQED